VAETNGPNLAGSFQNFNLWPEIDELSETQWPVWVKCNAPPSRSYFLSVVVSLFVGPSWHYSSTSGSWFRCQVCYTVTAVMLSTAVPPSVTPNHDDKSTAHYCASREGVVGHVIGTAWNLGCVTSRNAVLL